MLIADTSLPAIDSPSDDWRQPVGEGSDRPPRDAYHYALRDEAAYLQTDEDAKPTSLAVIALIFICDKCVANFAESLAQERPKAPPTP
jgi:hypothetical protein